MIDEHEEYGPIATPLAEAVALVLFLRRLADVVEAVAQERRPDQPKPLVH